MTGLRLDNFFHLVLNENKINFFLFFFFIQFNVPFKIISLIEMSQWVVGAKWEYPGKTT